MGKNNSEFGKGLCYNLGMFLAHEGRFKNFVTGNEAIEAKMKQDFPDYNAKDSAAECWFNGASDHLYELEIPETLPKTLQNRLKRFRDKCLTWGHGFPTDESAKAKEKDFHWSLQEAKDLLRLIDRANGVSTIKGTWE